MEITTEPPQIELDAWHNTAFLRFVQDSNKDSLKAVYFKEGNSFAVGYKVHRPVTFNPEKYFKGRLMIVMRHFGLDMSNLFCIYVPYKLKSQLFGDRLKLIAAIEDYARSKKMAGVIYPGVMETILGDDLRANDYNKAFVNMNMFMDIDFPSYDGLLASIRKTFRNELKADERLLLRSKAVVRQLGEESCKDIAKLQINTFEKYGTMQIDLGEESWRKIIRLPNASIYGGFLESKLAAFTWTMHDSHTYYAARWGTDYALTKGSGLYFGLVFPTQIKAAMRHKCKVLDYGSSMYRPKHLRGCKRREVNLYCKVFNPLFNRLIGLKMSRLGKNFYRGYLEQDGKG